MYWHTSGTDMTQDTLQLAAAALRDRELNSAVIASNTGETVLRFLALDPEPQWDIICITHQVGYIAPGQIEMSVDMRQKLVDCGVKVLTTSHLFSGVARGVRNAFGGLYPGEIMAQTLKMLSPGVKVAVEIAISALDAGLIEFGREVIAVAGTRRGADTACVVRPSHSNAVFDTRVLEVVCRPRYGDPAQ